MKNKINLLGVGVNILNIDLCLGIIDNWIHERQRNYVCVVPAHSIMDAYHDPDFRNILNSSGLTTPDGMSIVWIMKLKGHSNVSRVYGPDLLLSLCESGIDHGYRHYFYGGHKGVLEELIKKLEKRYSGISIAGSYSPPFRELTPEEDHEIAQKINDTGADIVWVGISSPKQEVWMANHLGKIEAPVMIGVGAAFDFLSGRKRQAPRWIQRSGFEWLFRLATEPKRLWPRYRQYPKFVLLVLAQLIGLKKFPIE